MTKCLLEENQITAHNNVQLNEVMTKAPATAMELHTSSLNIISPECFFHASSVSTVAMDKCSVDFFFRILYSHPVALGNMVFVSGEDTKKWLPPPLW